MKVYLFIRARQQKRKTNLKCSRTAFAKTITTIFVNSKTPPNLTYNKNLRTNFLYTSTHIQTNDVHILTQRPSVIHQTGLEEQQNQFSTMERSQQPQPEVPLVLFRYTLPLQHNSRKKQDFFFLFLRSRLFLSLRCKFLYVQVCSTIRKERELGLDRRETGQFYPTVVLQR